MAMIVELILLSSFIVLWTRVLILGGTSQKANVNSIPQMDSLVKLDGLVISMTSCCLLIW